MTPMPRSAPSASGTPTRRACAANFERPGLTAGNSKWVQMALDTMNTSINDAFARARDSAMAQVADDQFNAGTAGARWLLTYANPTNWYDPNATDNFSELTISSKNKVDDNSTTTHGYTFGADYNGGIWSAGAKSEGEFKNTQHHMNADEISIKCKIAKVSIVRPWFDETLFRSDNWFTNLKSEDETLYISNGKLDSTNADNVLPMYPIAFIVARDIEITANFTKEDQEIISQLASDRQGPATGHFRSAAASVRQRDGPFRVECQRRQAEGAGHAGHRLGQPGLPPSPKRSRKVLDA